MKPLLDNTTPPELPNILFDVLGGDDFEDDKAFDRNMKGVAIFLSKHGKAIRNKLNLVLIGGEQEQIEEILLTEDINEELLKQVLLEYADQQYPMDYANAQKEDRENNSISKAVELLKTDPQSRSFYTNGSTGGATVSSTIALRQRLKTPVNENGKAISALSGQLPGAKIADIGADPNYGYNYDKTLSTPPLKKRLSENKYIRLLYSQLDSLGISSEKDIDELPQKILIGILSPVDSEAQESFNDALEFFKANFQEKNIEIKQVEIADVFARGETNPEIVLCDGLTGNLILKTTEAIGDVLKRDMPLSFFTSLKKGTARKKELRPFGDIPPHWQAPESFGLLTNGTEPGKGTAHQKALSVEFKEMFKEQFKGNLEPKDLYTNRGGNGKDVDTILTSIEGMRLITEIENVFSQYRFRILKDYIKKNPGAGELIGIEKPVFIGHGDSDSKHTANALKNMSERVLKK